MGLHIVKHLVELHNGALTLDSTPGAGTTFRVWLPIADFTEALRIDPGLVAAYQGRGIALAKLGEPERALQDLNEAIRLNPDYAQAYFNRGLLRAKLGDLEGAQDDREAAFRLDPSLRRRP